MGNKKDENQLEIAEMAKEKDVVKPKIKVEEKAENKTEKKEQPKIEIKDEKLKNIVKKAKETGKMTYEELAKELEDTNPEQIDKVFDAFEEMGVSLLNDDFEEEPDVDDLKEDLSRRDFIMNTLCIDSNGNYIDNLNAIKDIENKIIKEWEFLLNYSVVKTTIKR